MIYPFKCDICDKHVEAVRHHSRSGDVEFCPQCLEPMTRIWTSPLISVPSKEGFNNGLGCAERDVKDQIKRLADGTKTTLTDQHGRKTVHEQPGVDIVEVGNEKAKVKPRQADYSLTKDDHAKLNKILGE